jgi:hypothetical protein
MLLADTERFVMAMVFNAKPGFLRGLVPVELNAPF